MQEEINIRSAAVTDAAAIAKLKVDGWQGAFSGIVPQDYLDGLTYQVQAERLRTILAENKPRFHAFVAVGSSQDIVGFCCGGPNRSTVDSFDGELWAIYVSIASQGQGVGRKLLAATAGQLYTDGFNRMVVWCLDGNPYCRFYEKMGGRIVGEKWDMIGGKTLKQFGYGWDKLEAYSY